MPHQNIIALAQEYYNLDLEISEYNNLTLRSILEEFLSHKPPSEILKEIRKTIKSSDLKVCAKELLAWCEMHTMLEDLKDSEECWKN